MGQVVTAADTEMIMVTVDTAQVTRDLMTETGDQVAAMVTDQGTDIQTHGPVGRQARTAVNHLPRETDETVHLETETGGMRGL